MDYSQLLDRLSQSGSFTDRTDAEHALVTTLETLGYLLAEQHANAVAAALPTECRYPLELGRVVSSASAHPDRPAQLPAELQTRITTTCKLLEPILATDLLDCLVRDLPVSYAEPFREGYAHRSAARRERYAEEHPAGYLASLPRGRRTERVGHPVIDDQPGYGPEGGRILSDSDREMSLSEPLPDRRNELSASKLFKNDDTEPMPPHTRPVQG